LALYFGKEIKHIFCWEPFLIRNFLYFGSVTQKIGGVIHIKEIHMNNEEPKGEVAPSQNATIEAKVDHFAGFDFEAHELTLEGLLKAGVHFGHLKSRRHPMMDPYIFTTRKNINILDLAQTEERLIKAGEILAEAVKSGKPVLFVGMKKQTHDTILSITKAVEESFVIDRWLGGTLTNWNQIRGRAKYLKEMLASQASGEFKKYTKFEQAKKNEEIERLVKKVGGIQDMTTMPGVIVIADVKDADLVVHEARKMNIPLIGIVDTNTNPSQIDYPIPGNDDAVSSLRYIFGYLGKVVVAAKKARKEGKAAE
jgi:small subunit ribosomal protein S2